MLATRMAARHGDVGMIPEGTPPFSPDGMVTLLIPTFRRLDMLQKCLIAVRASARRFDQVVAIARSKDDPEAWAWLMEQRRHYPELEVVDVAIPGQVQAMNAGLDVVRGDFVAILDDDALVAPDWLGRLLAHFGDPMVGGAGGRDFVHEGGGILPGAKPIAGVRNSFGILTGNHHLVVGPPRQVDSLKGCNWLLRRTALGSLRFEDRLLGRGAQVRNETWMCYNLTHAGWKLVLDPGACVDHYPGARADGDRAIYSRVRCHEQTANTVAVDLAFASPWQKAKYLAHSLVVGTRSCPGAYYLVHSVARRPDALPDMVKGGWSGFARGWRMAGTFAASPPGRAGTPPTGTPA